MSASGFVPSTVRTGGSDSALALPARVEPPPRPSVPWLASAVPVVGALGFWALTGSVFALWFAVLGPLIAVAGLADGMRASRRVRTRAARDHARARERVRAQIVARHDAERETLRLRHPDVAGFLARREQIWRPVPERDGVIVLGEGIVDSAVRMSPSADADADDLSLVDEARALSRAPVAVSVGTGIAVVGPTTLARAVVRALVLQLALAHPPGGVEVVGGGEDWIGSLPHANVRAARRIVVGRSGEVPGDADVLVLDARPREPLPPRCGLVLTLTAAGEARAELGAEARTVTVEAVSRAQAAVIAAELAARSRAAASSVAVDDGPLELRALRASERRRDRVGLPAAIGTAGGRAFSLDLVRDGPHAVVTGMTGAGKSELLVTWVLALCATYRTDDVAFLLADFKGGTAFDPLRGLPHVTGVITDLDTRTARCAIESLRAEVRHREAVLAGAGVRDVAEVDLPRLVIVVDEFAALREAQPELEALFGDIAARGRALGMHLVLGTQRAGGVLRDSLLANVPLRVALRVADRLDSRAVVGTDDAADLPGGDEARGRAIVRRRSDDHPVRVRIALSAADDIAAGARGAGAPPRAPWLPELPARVELDALLQAVSGASGASAPSGETGETGLVVGLLDEPDRQRRSILRLRPGERGLLVVGGAAAGKTTALHTLAAQVPRASRVEVGPDPEQAWDALQLAVVAPAGTTVIVDDLDLLASRLPDEYARTAADLVERLLRDGGARGIRVIAAAHRLTGLAGRVADLFPRRLILATATRADHVAAGGAPADHALCTGVGRGVVDGLAVQVAVAPAGAEPPPRAAAPVWDPPAGCAGLVTRDGSAAIARWERSGVRVRAVDDHAEPGGTVPADERVVVVGTPEQWLARPRLLERTRAHVLVIDAACVRDLRMLLAERASVPYADAARGRGWEFARGHSPRRVTLDPTRGP